MRYQFTWWSDTDDDGLLTDESARYTSQTVIPTLLDPADGGRQHRAAVFPTLDGGTLLLRQGRQGYADGRAPGQFTVTWEQIPDALLWLIQEDYARNRLVKIALDHRWRQLEVTSSGAADRTVTVAAGYLLQDADTYWLGAATDHVCAALDTLVYATLAAGAVTVQSGTVLPADAVQLAEISIAADVVTVTSDPSGVQNARQGRILTFKPTAARGGGYGLQLTIQELHPVTAAGSGSGS